MNILHELAASSIVKDISMSNKNELYALFYKKRFYKKMSLKIPTDFS